MNARPTFNSLDPVQSGPFNQWDHRSATNYNRPSWRTAKKPVLPAAFNAIDHVTPQAVASIHRAFTLAKTSHNAWRSYKREGRFDPRRSAGATRLEQDVFKRKTGRSTTHVHVAVLIDASGSMHGGGTAVLPDPTEPTSKRRIRVTAAMAAAVFGATIAKALGQVPTVDLDVFQHSADDSLFIKWRWHRGTPIAAFNEAVLGRPGGGNADGHAVFAITSRMQKTLKRDERGIIMVVSDGMPSVYSSDGDGQAGQALIDAVAFARKQGIEVIAVAVDGSDQSVFYGKDAVVPFTGDWSVLGRELAVHVGKALAPR